jgi:transposase
MRNGLDDKEILRLYLEEGMSPVAIAVKVGATKGGIRLILRRQGVVSGDGAVAFKWQRAPSAKQKQHAQQILQMYYDEGEAAYRIAFKLGLSQEFVKTCLATDPRGLRGQQEAHELRLAKLNSRFTKEQLLAEMEAADWVAAEVAKKLGIGYAVLLSALTRYSIKRKTWTGGGRPGQLRTPEWVEAAVAQFKAGKSIAEIAQSLGRTYGAVLYHFRKLDISATGQRKAARARGVLTLPGFKMRVIKTFDVKACEICKESRCVDLAHIKPNKLGGPMAKENILLLCPTHHRCFDQFTLTREEFALIRDRVRAAEKAYDYTIAGYAGWGDAPVSSQPPENEAGSVPAAA